MHFYIKVLKLSVLNSLSSIINLKILIIFNLNDVPLDIYKVEIY